MIIISAQGIKFPLTSDAVISDFPEPTRSILRAAYAAGDYEILPAPELIDLPPLPNWQAWQLAVLGSPQISTFFEQIPIVRVAGLTTLIGQVSDKPETVNTIAALWGQLAGSMPKPLREEVKEAAVSNNLPDSFVAII